MSAAAANAVLDEEQPGAAGGGQTESQGMRVLHQPMPLLGYNGEEWVKGSKRKFLYVQEKAKPH